MGCEKPMPWSQNFCTQISLPFNYISTTFWSCCLGYYLHFSPVFFFLSSVPHVYYWALFSTLFLEQSSDALIKVFKAEIAPDRVNRKIFFQLWKKGRDSTPLKQRLESCWKMRHTSRKIWRKWRGKWINALCWTLCYSWVCKCFPLWLGHQGLLIGTQKS